MYLLTPLIFLFIHLYLKHQRELSGTIQERLGNFESIPGNDKSSPRIWLHAVSVGEAAAASGILEELKKIYPNSVIIVSTTTKTGREMVKKRLNGYDGLIYFPFDFPWVVKRVVNRIRPDLFLCLETEHWPNITAELNKFGTRKILLNGRVSDRMLNPIFLLRPMYRFIFGSYDILGMQTDTDADRIISLGAESGKVKVTGNLKFEGSYLKVGDDELRDLRDRMNLKKGNKLVLAGSTHPGEEEMVMQAFVVLKNIFPAMKIIIAPRLIERVEEIEKVVLQFGYKSSRFSELDGYNDANEVIIVDVIGELPKLYALGQVAFVGGSLVDRGGHNLLEPVAQGVPVVHGPFVHNFRDMASFLGDEGRNCAYRVEDVHELSLVMKFLIEQEERIVENRRRCFKAISDGSGATARSMELIQEVMSD